VLDTQYSLPDKPWKLRGNIASLYPDNDIYHQHVDSGLKYSYPRIHYHIISGAAVITGWLEGVEETKRLFLKIDSLQLGHLSYKVIRKELKIEEQDFGSIDERQRYRFVSPWLALNSANYKKYRGCNRDQKKKLLEKILIGNLLSVSKGLGYTVSEQISASIIYLRPAECRLKGTPVIGFNGAFEANFDLPNLLGLGKSVSRGFGAVTRI
jgi:hypothetical protein